MGSGCPCLSDGLGRRGAAVQRGAGRGQARPPWGNDHPWNQPCAHRGVSRYPGSKEAVKAAAGARSRAGPLRGWSALGGEGRPDSTPAGQTQAVAPSGDPRGWGPG